MYTEIQKTTFFASTLSKTRELPGVDLVNISNGQIFTGKGNTYFKWNNEVAHVEEKIIEWGTIFCEAAF